MDEELKALIKGINTFLKGAGIGLVIALVIYLFL